MYVAEDLFYVVCVSKYPLVCRSSYNDKRHVEQSHDEVTNSQAEEEDGGSFLEVSTMTERVYDHNEVSRKSQQEKPAGGEGEQ